MRNRNSKLFMVQFNEFFELTISKFNIEQNLQYQPIFRLRNYMLFANSTFLSNTNSFEHPFLTLNLDSTKLTDMFKNLDQTLRFQSTQIQQIQSESKSLREQLKVQVSKVEQTIHQLQQKNLKIENRLNEGLHHCTYNTTSLDKQIKYVEQSIKDIQNQIKESVKLLGADQKEISNSLKMRINEVKNDIIGNKQNDEEHEKIICFEDLSSLSKYFQNRLLQCSRSIAEDCERRIKQNQKELQNLKNYADKHRFTTQSNYRPFHQSHKKHYTTKYYSEHANQGDSSQQEQINLQQQSYVDDKKLRNSQEVSVRGLVSRVEELENAIFGRNGLLLTVENKLIVFDQKNDIVHRKANKTSLELNEIKRQVSNLEAIKKDDRPFKNINQRFKSLQANLKDQMSHKCEISDVLDEKKKTDDKISILHQNMIDKAEKSEVKRALVFIQNKIKEIITLIACNQNEQRDSSLTKNPLKCLSCDKQVEKVSQSFHNTKEKGSKFLINCPASRPLTSKMKKYRQQCQINQTVQNETLSHEL